MSYAKQTVDNENFIKQFSHRKRFKVALRFVNIGAAHKVLDYGTGDGYFLNCLYDGSGQLEIFGYEPLDIMYSQLEANISSNELSGIHLIKDLNDIPNVKFDIIYCLEVLEHFSEKNQIDHLINMQKHLAESGNIVVSVPLEIGLSSLFKNVTRILIKQRHGLSSVTNIMRALFGLAIKRKDDFYINSHIGFNHKNLENTFKKEGFCIVKKRFSPFHLFYGLFNSQVFYLLKK